MTYAPNTVTVASMITGARERADMLNTQFVTDTEIVSLIDQSYRKLYNEIINRFENYYVSEATIVLVPGQRDYDLPADFLKLLGVDIVSGGKNFTMQPWSLNERNRLLTGWVSRPIRYILKGGKISFVPVASSADSITMFYVPSPAEITAVSSVEVFSGFDEFIMCDVAIMLKQKEESDCQILLIQKAEQKQMIMETLQGRDSGFPQKMTDMARINDRAWFQFWGM